MTRQEVIVSMGLKQVTEGMYKGAYEIDDLTPEMVSSKMVGIPLVYHPNGADTIYFQGFQSEDGRYWTTIARKPSLEGFTKYLQAKGLNPYDEKHYNDYKFVVFEGDALQTVEKLPWFVPTYEREEGMPAPFVARNIYEKWMSDQSVDAVISNDGEVMNTSKPVTSDVRTKLENRGELDSDSMNPQSIRNEGTGKSGEEQEEKRKHFWSR